MEKKVNESEIEGIEKLSLMEKRHLLAQLVRDRTKDTASGPWEITDVHRGGWKTIKDSMIQPVEIDINDLGKEASFRMWLDITDSEREIEITAKYPHT